MKSRYCYNTCTAKRVGRRCGLVYRFRRWKAIRRQAKPDLYPVTGFYPMIYPEK
ncbi:MAG: hypothetical protein J6P40_07330 [Oscillospiraceae bacterium]|nr:hypothetical protein [Oscillospiraceae bacterium]